MTVEKLNALFEAIGACNTEVAEYCGFDRTNISRLRSGKRELRRESSTAGKLAEGICGYAAEHGSFTRHLRGGNAGSGAELALRGDR